MRRSRIIGKLLEKAVDRLQPFGDSLGVVDALDANRHDVTALPQVSIELLFLLFDFSAECQCRLPLEIDADRKRPYQGRLVVADDLGLFMVDARLDRAVNCLDESSGSDI